MVIDFREVILLLTPPLGWAIDEIRDRIEIHRRHTNCRKAELIGTIKVTSISELICFNRAPLLVSDQRDDLIDGGLAETHERYIVRMTPNIAAVVINICRYFSGGKSRVRRIVLGTKQALFFSSYQGHQYGTTRRLRQCLERFGNRHYLCNAGRVVHGTVVNRITVVIGLTDTKMIMMRGVNNHFILQPRITTRNQAKHIGRSDTRHFDIHGERRRHAQQHRLEVTIERGFTKVIQIHASHGNKIPGRIFCNPSGQLAARLISGG